MKTMILAALVAATTPLVSPAAETLRASTVVATSDLDLSRAADRNRLDRRIVLAARAVCGDASSFDLAGRRKIGRCRETVRIQALPARDALLVRAGGVALATR